MAAIPKTSTSLVLPAHNAPLALTETPITPPTHGTALVFILSTTIRPYARQSFTGKHFFSYSLPYAPGNTAVARVIAPGPDAVALRPGQLVFVNSFIRARDDPERTQIMLALHDGGAENTKKLFGAWDGLWRDVAAVPLENCLALDEHVLTNMGYSFSDMLYLERLAVAKGATSAVDLQAGDTVIVTPASGQYSGAISELAAQLGCRVLALSRDPSKLTPLTSRHPRITPVQLTGDAAADKASILAHCPRGPDALIEISPFQATASPGHLTTGLEALRPGARVALLGSMGDVSLNLASLMGRNINIKGQWMYTRAQLVSLINSVEAGIVKLGAAAGHEVVEGGWKLADWETAIAAAEGVTQWGRQTVFTP